MPTMQQVPAWKSRRVFRRARKAIWLWDSANAREAIEALFRLHDSGPRKDDGGGEARREGIFHTLREYPAEGSQEREGTGKGGLVQYSGATTA